MSDASEDESAANLIDDEALEGDSDSSDSSLSNSEPSHDEDGDGVD